MGKKKAVIIDGVDTSTLTREKLEAFALQCRNELEREREERNFFQIERDKIRTFWEITKNQLAEAQATIRDKIRDVEKNQELSDIDIKHVVQQMKYLQYENQTKIAMVRTDDMAQLQLAQENYGLQLEEILKDKQELRKLLKEKEETTEVQLQQLKMHCSEQLSKQKEALENEALYLQAFNEQKVKQMKEQSDFKSKMDMFEVSERKNNQIAKLIENHDTALNDLKIYYNDITMNNLALISSLKEQLDELRSASERNERLVSEVNAQNRNLVEPLKIIREDLKIYRRKLELYEKDKAQLARLKLAYRTTSKELEAIKWETEVLRMSVEVLTKERDQLKSSFESAVLEIQEKSSLKNVLLERKIETLEFEAEKREASFDEYLKASNLEPLEKNTKLENIFDSKNEMIHNLRYELTRVCKAHDDLLATYEAKLNQFGIPKSEIGFQPLRTTLNIKFGKGPAGLVTKNI